MTEPPFQSLRSSRSDVEPENFHFSQLPGDTVMPSFQDGTWRTTSLRIIEVYNFERPNMIKEFPFYKNSLGKTDW